MKDTLEKRLVELEQQEKQLLNQLHFIQGALAITREYLAPPVEPVPQPDEATNGVSVRAS